MATTLIQSFHAAGGDATQDRVYLASFPCAPGVSVGELGVGAVRAKIVRHPTDPDNPINPPLLAVGWVRPPANAAAWAKGDVDAAGWDPGPYPGPMDQWTCATFSAAPVPTLGDCAAPPSLRWIDDGSAAGPTTLWLRPPRGSDLTQLGVDGGAWCVTPTDSSGGYTQCDTFAPDGATGLMLWQPADERPTIPSYLTWRPDGECVGEQPCVNPGRPGPCGVGRPSFFGPRAKK